MSSKMRMDRYNNRLTKLKSQREGHNLDKLPRKDKAAVPSHSATLSDCGPGIQSEEDYQASVRELQLQHNKPAKEQDMAHIRVLLRETFQRRRSWIQGLEGGCIKEILKIYPLFQYGKFLMEEFQIIWERSQKTLDAVGDRLRHFLETISEIMPLKDLRQNDHRIPSILQYAETQTAIRKGRGQKSMPAVEVWNDISEEDLLKQKPCKESAPMLAILLKGNLFEYAVLLCDGQVLYTQACDSAQALLVLMASYYVFELDYPRAFSQFLGLLQQKVVGDPYTGHRALRLQHFLAKL